MKISSHGRAIVFPTIGNWFDPSIFKQKEMRLVKHEVLQFDHREQSTKTAEISALLTYSRERIDEEIDKCDIRCANCHVKRTRRQLGWWTDDLAVSPLATNELKG